MLTHFKNINTNPVWKFLILCSDEQQKWMKKAMGMVCNAGVESIYWIRSNVKPQMGKQGLTQRIIFGFVGYFSSK
jgi:hypothetical protein